MAKEHGPEHEIELVTHCEGLLKACESEKNSNSWHHYTTDQQHVNKNIFKYFPCI